MSLPASDGLDGIERRSTAERTESAEDPHRVGIEQLDAPVERCAQRALAFRQIACAARQQRETLAEAGGRPFRPERPHSSRSELEREWKPVESSTDARDRTGVLVGDREERIGRVHPLDVEADGRDVLDALGRVGAEVGHRQRLHSVDPLARDAQWCAARRDHAKLVGCIEQASQVDGRVEHLLEVVEDEQHRLLAERGDHGLDRVPSRRLARAEGVRHRGDDEGRIGDGREVDEDGPNLGGDSARRRERKPRLPGPAGSGERHEPDLRARQEAGQGYDLELAADERRRVGRELVPLRLGRWRRAQVELRILAEDLLLEAAQLGGGLQTELVEGCARVPVRRQRVGLPAGAVEREHLPGAECLAMRVLGDERFELGSEQRVASRVEVDRDPRLERGEPCVVEPRRLGLGEGLVAEVRERRTAPEGQRFA